MIFKGFKLHAIPHVAEAYCTKKGCKRKGNGELIEVSNGFLSRAFFCPECQTVYGLELRPISPKKISKEYLQQCFEYVERDKRETQAIVLFNEEVRQGKFNPSLKKGMYSVRKKKTSKRKK